MLSATREELVAMVLERDDRIAKLEKELATEKKRVSAYRALDHTQQQIISHQSKELTRDSRIDNAARSTLDSEREANAILTEKIAELERERDILADHCRKMTKALTHLAGGGSEFFIRSKVSDPEFVADVDACVSRIREIRQHLNESMVDAIRAHRQVLNELGKLTAESKK